MSDILRFLSWYLLISLLGLAALPVVFRFFPKLPGRGFVFARPLGLLLWGFVFWLLTSLGILQNNLGGETVALAGLIALGAWASTGGTVRELKTWLRQNSKTILTMELLFLGMFLFWTIMRGMNPEVAYTEKPMELAFINSILKSPSFPPQDPWLSGYAISYYYFGYVLIAMLTRATGAASAVAFNLSSALWFALTALAAYGIVFDLVYIWQRRIGGIPAPHDSRFPRLAGFLGPLYILIVSTFEGVLEIFHSGGVFWKAGADGNLTSRFWTWLSIADLDLAPQLPFSWIPSRSSGWLWWRGSRVLQDLNLANQRIEVIDEFPFFSYLLSDLHPHVLAMPFVLLAVAVALNFYLNAGNFLKETRNIHTWMKSSSFWLTALILGSLAFINTWDFPIYVGLLCVVWGFSRYRQEGWSGKILLEFIKNGLVLGIAGVALFLPFYFGFSSQAGGLLPSLEFMTKGIHFWILFGALLIPIIAWLFFTWKSEKVLFRLANGLKFTAILLIGLFIVMILYGLFLFTMGQVGPAWAVSENAFIAALGIKMVEGGAAFSGVHANYPAADVLKQAFTRRVQSPGTWVTLGLMLTMVIGLLVPKQKNQSLETESVEEDVEVQNEPDIRLFVLILVLLGIMLTAFPEFFYLRDQFGWRMNTIFKFYFQGWILWGLAAAFGSAVLFNQLTRVKGLFFRIALSVVLIAGLAYPVVMLSEKTNGFSMKGWTLDGNAYINIYNPEDYAAIQWLQAAPMGVIAEAIGGSYTDYARISTRTGLPTVLGWPGHESQWRGGGEEMGSRMADIQTLYESQNWEEVSTIIQKYNIRYIYVGNLERSTYNVTTAKFDSMLNVVYSNQGAVIYEVVEELRRTSQGQAE